MRDGDYDFVVVTMASDLYYWSNKQFIKTKIIFDDESKTVLGVGIVGPSAGDIISEGMLAIEMGSDAEDIGLTMHPHPTLGETMAAAAEVFTGSITDLYIPPKK